MREEEAVNPLRALSEFGQSVWLDYIRRTLIVSGELRRLVEEDGLRGVTSNPTIFEKAIAGSTDYDAALQAVLTTDPHADCHVLYEKLAVEDIQMAADVLRPVYDASGQADGFVSLEVSPHLAHDTDGSVVEAERLWRAVSRPNVMIKVPATPEGIPAIEALTGRGINVNVTLIFSLAQYEPVAAAYLRGLRRVSDPGRVASVASFFVSRVDTAVDRLLERRGTSEALALRGRSAIANARTAYRRFREIFDGDAFATLRTKGARPQRPLWASTGTKDPAYSDVRYVEELIGADTVNTMPPATMSAFRQHGRPRASLEAGPDDAALLERLAALGIDLGAIAERLQQEGLAAFAESFEKLLATIEEKRRAMLGVQVVRQTFTLAACESRVKGRLEQWQSVQFARRLWAKDPTLWFSQPVPEIVDRLGWLDLHETMQEQLDDLQSLAEEIRTEGTRHVVLLGMGGSSLAPETFQRVLGNAPGYPDLIVLDSTHPMAIRAVETRLDLTRTLFVVSSKSGTTLESLSLFRFFWDRMRQTGQNVGSRFIAITDPGTPLEALAVQRRFRRVFRAPSDIGGRYSALSVFGLVPAALIGVDLPTLLDRTWTMAEACSFCVPAPQNPALRLGATLGELARTGRDKVTFVTSRTLAGLPAWLEQLIAESTGKENKGLLPVADAPLGDAAVYGDDRLFVALLHDGEEDAGLQRKLDALTAAGHPAVILRLGEPVDLGQEIFRWEVAVAAAGSVLGIHPFDQPDVELAKQLAREAMQTRQDPGRPEDDQTLAVSDARRLAAALKRWLADARPGDYVALQAYLSPTSETDAALRRIRVLIRDRLKLATTVGYGPRFLHSTGQFHKGGPNTGLFLQLVDEPQTDVPVPETDFTFGALIRAQALGDYRALGQRRRRVRRVNLGRDVHAGLDVVADALA